MVIEHCILEYYLGCVIETLFKRLDMEPQILVDVLMNRSYECILIPSGQAVPLQIPQHPDNARTMNM
jgi:hypothetical protein